MSVNQNHIKNKTSTRHPIGKVGKRILICCWLANENMCSLHRVAVTHNYSWLKSGWSPRAVVIVAVYKDLNIIINQIYWITIKMFKVIHPYDKYFTSIHTFNRLKGFESIFIIRTHWIATITHLFHCHDKNSSTLHYGIIPRKVVFDDFQLQIQFRTSLVWQTISSPTFRKE